ncbi:MAG: UDP-N-acetylglucosamine 2-epimerase, partial [Planctomycetota bacterium]
LHFAATEEAALRLRAMGEEEWRIHRVGAPGLDGIHEAARAAAEALPEEERHSPPPVVFLFHADRLAQERAGEVARGILEELRGRDLPVVAIYPNSDPGSDAIVAEIERALAAAPERLTVHRSLPRRRFLGLLARARVLVGNSSAGIIEAPALGLPAVNVGERNRRREHGANVLFVDREPGSLKRALDRALGDPSWLASLKEAPNPYGDGRAAQRIASILAEISIDEAFYRKRLTI